MERWKCFRARESRCLHNIVNTANAIELYTLTWFIVLYVKFTSIKVEKKKQLKRKEFLFNFRVPCAPCLQDSWCNASRMQRVLPALSQPRDDYWQFLLDFLQGHRFFQSGTNPNWGGRGHLGPSAPRPMNSPILIELPHSHRVLVLNSVIHEYLGLRVLRKIKKKQITKGHGFMYRGHCGHPPLSLTTILGKGPLPRPGPEGWQCLHSEFLQFIWIPEEKFREMFAFLTLVLSFKKDGGFPLFAA